MINMFVGSGEEIAGYAHSINSQRVSLILTAAIAKQLAPDSYGSENAFFAGIFHHLGLMRRYWKCKTKNSFDVIFRLNLREIRDKMKSQMNQTARISHAAPKLDRLSIDRKVNFSILSVDVLFESAADAYGKRPIGAILTGLSSDGGK